MHMTHEDEGNEFSKKHDDTKKMVDTYHGLANARHAFGEHGGVNMSIEASATFIVMELETMGRMFSEELGP